MTKYTTKLSRRLRKLKPVYTIVSFERFQTNRRKQKNRRKSKRIQNMLPSSPANLDNQSLLNKNSSRVLLRSDDKPRCSDFGLYRDLVYKGQGFYFCENYQKYNPIRVLSKRVKRNTRSHRCKANHTSFHFPTDKNIPKCLYCPSRSSVYKKKMDLNEEFDKLPTVKISAHPKSNLGDKFHEEIKGIAKNE